MSRLLRPVLALLLLLAAVAPARAQDTVSAKEHYQRGTSYYDLGRYADAIKEFEAAYQIKNDPALLFNLAQSHRLAGNVDQALHFYKTYLRYVPHPSNRAEIDSRIDQLEALAAQKNAAQTAPPAQTIPPSGTTSAPPAAEPTTPAPATVTPIAPAPPMAATPPPSYAPAPTYAPTPVAAANTPDPNVGRALRYTGIGAMSLGGLFVIIGAIEGGRATGAAKDVNDAAAMGGTFDPAVESRGKSAESAEKGFLWSGVLIGAAGGILYYLGHRQQESAVQVTPVASSDGMGASVRGIF
ncbi:MAG TPA: tetratricopeptide repeat protein [Polyangia bacterium]|nr:tetratricopeptide repeat protein [Polyangia bacterium]